MFYKDFDIIAFMVKLVTKNTKRKDLTADEIGGKGLGLVKLSRLEKELSRQFAFHFENGVNIPNFFIIPDKYDLKNFDSIRKYAEELNAEKFAVRSSYPLEDNIKHSFDGIFKTNLNVGINDLGDAIEDVRKSALSEGAKKHAEQLGLTADDSMAVIVQEMINDATIGVAYSKFPSPYNIAKVIEMYQGEYEVNVFLRNKNKKEIVIDRRLIDGSICFSEKDEQRGIVVSSGGFFSGTKEDHIAELSLFVEKHFKSPVRMEYLFKNERLYVVQVRPVAGKDNLVSKISLPEIKDGLVFGTSIVNGSGDITLPAVNIVTENETRHGLPLDEVKKLDLKYPGGYVLICYMLKFGPGFAVPETNNDKATPNKKAVVAVSNLGQHHDLDISREKNILYLGTNLVDMRMKNHKGIQYVVKTGDKVRVVSDGMIGFLYNV